MKPSEIAKKLGLKSLREVADLTQTTSNGLSLMRNNHPEKFLCLTLGAAAIKLNPDLKELIQDDK